MNSKLESKNWNYDNQQLVLKIIRDESHEVIKKILSKSELNQQVLPLLQKVAKYFEKSTITNYLFFMKAKKVINKRLAIFIKKLQLPQSIKTNLINHITNYQERPELQNYLLSASEVTVTANQKLNITSFANQLTAAMGEQYALDYIRYVVGGSDNIVNLHLHGQIITIVVNDISQINWTFDPEIELYQFDEAYLFNSSLESEFLDVAESQNYAIFQEIKKQVNIDYIDNAQSRLVMKIATQNLNRINVRLVSNEDARNQNLFNKLKQFIKTDQESQMLSKSAMKAIKSDLFLKNGWTKYQSLKDIIVDRDLGLLYLEIKKVISTIAKSSHDDVAAIVQQRYQIKIDSIKDANYYFVVYYAIEDEIKKFIWEQIDEKIAAVILATFVDNQTDNPHQFEVTPSSTVKTNDPMNEMWDQYQNSK